MPECAAIVPLVRANSTPGDLKFLDAEAAKEVSKLPKFLLSSECYSALRSFICSRAFEGCASGHGVPICRSVCQAVHKDCNFVVRASMPKAARKLLACGQYTSDSWPRCGAPAGPDMCGEFVNGATRCATASARIVEAPCGECLNSTADGGWRMLQPLPVDACGVCNGDNGTCGAGASCDGVEARLDACGECGGHSTHCNVLQVDPHLLGFLAAGALSTLFLAALLRFLCLAALGRRRSPSTASLAYDVEGAQTDKPGPALRGKPPVAQEAKGREGPCSCIRVERYLPVALDTAMEPMGGRISEAVGRGQKRAFGALGWRIARSPWCTIVLSLVASLCCGAGLITLKVHEDPLSLWVPSDAPSVVNAQRLSAITGEPRLRAFIVMLTPAATATDSTGAGKPPRSVDLRDGLAQAMMLHGALANLSVGVPVPAGEVATTVDLLGDCSGVGAQQPAGAGCGQGLLPQRGLLRGVLGLWYHTLAGLAADPDPDATMRAAMQDRGFDGGISAGMLEDEVSFTSDAKDRRLRAIQLPYLLDGSRERRQDAAAWDRAASALALGDSSRWPAWKVNTFSEQGLSDDLMGAISGDVLLIVGGYVLMSVYTSAFLGRHFDEVRSRGIVAACAVVSVGLATLAAFGICALAGVRYNETCNIAVFVLVGVGIDDAFVIVSALEDVAESSNPPQTAESRLSAALADCGASIMLSSVTNAVAFALGAFTPLPALRSFCVYASAGMVMDFVFQITFFVAVLGLDERRLVLGRPALGASVAKRVLCKASAANGAPAAPGLAIQLLTRLHSSRRASRLLAAGFMFTSAASAVGAFFLDAGLQVTELVPAGSNTASFFERQEQWMDRAPREPVEVLVEHCALGHKACTGHGPRLLPGAAVLRLDSQRTFHGVRQLWLGLNASDFVSGMVAPLWMDTFADSLRRSAVRPPWLVEEQQDRLAAFLRSPTAHTLASTGALVIRDGNAVATRIRLLASRYDDKKMLALRGAIAASGLAPAAFAHGASDIYHEQDAIMVRYTAVNLLLIMAAVVFAVLVLSANLGFTLCLSACVLSCGVHMLGWMVLLGIRLNALSLIPLLLSVGLCIDFCTHVAHAYWGARGSAQEKAVFAIRSRGAAVLHGGISTGISQVFLLFGRSLVFTIFFRVMAGMVVVGLYHSLVVLPALLGPLIGVGFRDQAEDGTSSTPHSKQGHSGFPPSPCESRSTPDSFTTEGSAHGPSCESRDVSADVEPAADVIGFGAGQEMDPAWSNGARARSGAE